MTPINVAFDLANLGLVVIPVDRWGKGDFSIQVDSGTSVLVEGTLDRVNRGDTPTWDTLYGTILTSPDTKVALTAVTPAQSMARIENFPIEAIRITAAGACVGRVVQTGAQ